MKRGYAVLSSLVLGLALTGCSRQPAPGLPDIEQQAAIVPPPEPAAEVVTPPARPWYVRDYMRGGEWQPETLFRIPDGGMYELTQYPNAEPTPEQQQKARELIDKTWVAMKARGWTSKEQALKDGYQNMYKDKIHYYKEEYLYDGKTLDPERPEFLMFYPTQHGELLMGVMFGSVERGEQIGGPLTVWHFHIEPGICYRNGHLPIGQVDENGQCAEGVTRDHSPEMLHMWFFEHPDGRFATRMRLPEEYFKAAEEQVWELYHKN